MNITKELLENLYHKENKSMRKIAAELDVGKTTIEYYFKKFGIARRTREEANLLNPEEHGWTRGLTKDKDDRIARLSKSIKRSCAIKRKERIARIEKRFGKPIKELLIDLYVNKKLSQEQVSKKIGYDRKIVIDLMKEFKIPKRPKYQYISSLRGEKHSMFGKTWDKLYSKDDLEKRKRVSSARFRELTIKRLKNNEFPFFDTSIEISMAKALLKEKIHFIKQFNIDNKFSCDFALPQYNIIIECDGDYWHANPKIYDRKNPDKRQAINLKRDRFKDIYLTKKGWRVLRFFESEINENLGKCVNRIKSAIKGREELKKIPSPIDNL